MKTIIHNIYQLSDNDITDNSIRVKVLLINSKDEILVGFSYNTYQFIGGHVEKNEDLINALNREAKEETGIDLNLDNIIPFAKRIAYYKDYPTVLNNTKVEIYYYRVYCDKLPNLDKTYYTNEELIGNFKLEYIPLDKIKSKLVHNTVIENEMKEIIDILS